jgi:uncharacterized protein (TIGR03437 family)
LPLTLEDVSLTLDGYDAPLLAVSNVNGVQQINFQVPFELGGKDSARMVIQHGEDTTAPQTVRLSAQQPGIYTTDGTHAIAVHNSTFALVTDAEPLSEGETVFVYAAGLGGVTNPPPTGEAAPASPLAYAIAHMRVRLGGVDCEVPFAGLAPGFAGVYQINFQVPPGVPSGPVDLEVSAANIYAPMVKLPMR